MLDYELLSVEEVFDNNFIAEEYRCAWRRIKKEYIELAQQHLTQVKSSAIATAAQMPPTCAECPVNPPCMAQEIGDRICHAALWRHFF